MRELGARDPVAWSGEARSAVEAGVGALKLGLLPDARAGARLAAVLPAGTPAVLDPVLAASSGTRFHGPEAVGGWAEELLPAGLLWTPNLPELAELAGADLAALEVRLEAREAAARVLIAAGARAVVVKGGHGSEDPVVDLLVEGSGPALQLSRQRLAGRSLRGTGCRFASALAAHLALGRDLREAATEAGTWVAGRMAGL